MTIINNRYKLLKKLGSGSFGNVYKCLDIEKNSYLAIKVENKKNEKKRLGYEIGIYKDLNMNLNHKYVLLTSNIPKIHWYGSDENYNYLVLDNLGMSLDTLFMKHQFSFSLKTIIMLAIDLITLIENLHNNHILHRDLKPDNILIGNTGKENILYLVDFGLSKKYINNGEHIESKKNKGLIGSMRYASIRNHKGYEQSRRDELESIGYILLYFLKNGNLVWNGLPASDKNDKCNKILQVKKNNKLIDLCCGIPDEFRLLIAYARKLKFDTKPNYQYLKSLFYKLLMTQGYQYDKKYDWIT